MMFAVIQHGHTVYGVGASKEAAIRNAAEWLEGGLQEAESAAEPCGSLMFGKLYVMPCSKALHDAVAVAGDCRSIAIKGGLAFLPHEPEEKD